MGQKAEIFDQVQDLFYVTRYNDHQLHCVIRFLGKVDAAAVEKAVRLLVRAVPMLARAYARRGGKAFWGDAEDAGQADLFTAVGAQADFDAFTLSKTNEATGPQIRVCLLQAEQDALSVIVNHMVCDAAGLKECVYLLSGFYSQLLGNPDFLPGLSVDGDRGFAEILRDADFRSKIRLLLSDGESPRRENVLEFPLKKTGEVSPFILTHSVPPERYRAIRTYCHREDVTVNDFLLAAYFRALSETLNLEGRTLGVSYMIDMRRYLPDKSFKALTNLSSTSALELAVPPGEDFARTLVRVHTETGFQKAGYLGMGSFLKLSALFRCAGPLGYGILARSLRNPKIGITNIGVLDSSRLAFQDAPVLDAYLCGSIKYRPYFQMSASTFGDRMTLCVNLYGSSGDRNTVRRFFARMDGELANAEKTCGGSNP